MNPTIRQYVITFHILGTTNGRDWEVRARSVEGAARQAKRISQSIFGGAPHGFTISSAGSTGTTAALASWSWRGNGFRCDAN